MKLQLSLSVSLLLFLFYSCSDSDHQIEDSKEIEIPVRKIIIETNGTSRVLIQQINPPMDLFVMQMKYGDRNETIGRGTCKIFCSAREFVGSRQRRKDYSRRGRSGCSGILEKKEANDSPPFLLNSEITLITNLHPLDGHVRVSGCYSPISTFLHGHSRCTSVMIIRSICLHVCKICN